MSSLASPAAGILDAPDRQAIASAERRFAEATPLRAQRVIPSEAPLPLAAQRDVRGWILAAILILVLIAIGELVAVVLAVGGRTAVVAPTAERIGASPNCREATDAEAQALAMLLVMRLESWTPATAGSVWSTVLAYLHPALHQTLRAAYDGIAQRARILWQHRVAMPLGCASAGRSAGILTIAVFYDSVELTGEDVAHRSLSQVVPKAAYCQFALGEPTQENPLGLLLTRYQTFERAAWIAHGWPDAWDGLRAPPAH